MRWACGEGPGEMGGKAGIEENAWWTWLKWGGGRRRTVGEKEE